jgi:hypothetical protein
MSKKSEKEIQQANEIKIKRMQDEVAVLTQVAKGILGDPNLLTLSEVTLSHCGATITLRK